MSTPRTLQLTIMTQERELLTREVNSVSVMTTEGEITVLPGHIPLFTKLDVGELVFRWSEGSGSRSEEDSFSVSGGFLDVNPSGEVTILADYAIRSSDIDLAQAEAAREQAEAAMQNRESEVDFRMAETTLKRALNDLRVANRNRRTSGGGPQI
jgi:F-type H+-transporting ATPase subunit epsilon